MVFFSIQGTCFAEEKKCVFGTAGNEFILSKDGKEIFRTSTEGLDRIEEAIEEATRKIYIRTGDLVAIELDSRKMLYDRAEGIVNIHGTFCGNETVSFNIK